MTGQHRLVVAGGVSANRQLRQALDQTLGAQGIELFFPQMRSYLLLSGPHLTSQDVILKFTCLQSTVKSLQHHSVFGEVIQTLLQKGAV